MADPALMMMTPYRRVRSPLAMRAAVALGATLLLGGCASTHPIAPPLAGLAAPSRDASLYGLFLAGQSAMAAGQSRVAADFFAKAQAFDPDEVQLGERAFISALMAGEVPRAAQVASRLNSPSAPIHGLGVLVQAIDSLSRTPSKTDGKIAFDLLSGNVINGPYHNSALLITPLAAAAAGNWDVALALPAANGNPSVTVFSQLNQALLFERSGHQSQAASVYQSLLGTDQANGYLTAAYGAYLERQGKRDEARDLYNATLQGDPQNQGATEAIERLDRHKPAPPLPSLRQTAASIMLVSAMASSNQRQQQASLIFVQMALALDPKRDEALLVAGDLLALAKDTEGARTAYSRVQVNSAQFVTSRSRLVWMLNQEGDTQGAVGLAKDTVIRAKGSVEALSTLADILRVNSQFEESIATVDLVMAKRSAPSWADYFSRGMSRERSGHWPEAEQDLKKALELNPTEPEVMNYLGYSWIDRGEQLPVALDLVKRAVDARPDSGAMRDSLGWAYYRLSNYKLAVEVLEQAAQLDASDPDVNNHLGDAYWRAGRKIEAQFQWNRVLSLVPSDKLKLEVEEKISAGLPAEAAPTSAPVPEPIVPKTPRVRTLPKGGTAT